MPLVTASLLFLGEGSNVIGGPSGEYQWGTKFRAYQKSTGEVIWETDLGLGTTGGPMTYMHDGQQYIVLAISGGGFAGELIAFRLPG